MTKINIKELEARVLEDLAAERAAAAESQIRAKLTQIAKAEKVVQTLQMEYQELLADIELSA